MPATLSSPVGRGLALLVAALATSGCTGGGSADGGDEPANCPAVFFPDGGSDPAYANGRAFVAFACNFDGYKGWPSFFLDGGFNGGSVHASGPRTEYINRTPPHGSGTFPVGTIIVKELQADGLIFAMVKRGGGYNESGASGWEWFELNPDGGAGVGHDVNLTWRGVGPPAGETYGGDPTTCNACHRGAGNDSVPSPALQLSNF